MFSDNQKISSRQLHTLLITDWLGKVVLLLPASFQGASAWTILAGTVAGFAASELFLCLAVSVADRGKRDFFFCVKERLCSWAALLLYLMTGKLLKMNNIVAQRHYKQMVEYVDDDMVTMPSHKHLMRLYIKYGLFEPIE